MGLDGSPCPARREINVQRHVRP